MTNQRVTLTKQLLFQAIVTLSKSRKIDDISISELCREAGVNRSTFYKYYSTPSDVLQDLLISEQKDKMKPIYGDFSKDITGLETSMEIMLTNHDTSLTLNEELIRICASTTSPDLSEDYIASLLFRSVPEDLAPYARMMILHATNYWLKSEQPISPKRFTEMLVAVTAAISSCT